MKWKRESFNSIALRSQYHEKFHSIENRFSFIYKAFRVDLQNATWFLCGHWAKWKSSLSILLSAKHVFSYRMVDWREAKLTVAKTAQCHTIATFAVLLIDCFLWYFLCSQFCGSIITANILLAIPFDTAFGGGCDRHYHTHSIAVLHPPRVFKRIR